MAAGPGVAQEISSQLTPEMQTAAQQMVASGRAPNITWAVNYILEHPEYIPPSPMETSRSVGWWLFAGAAALFGGSLLYYLLRDDRERNPDREEVLAAILDVLPLRGALGINELHEAAKDAYEDRGWGLATWNRADTDVALAEGLRLHIIDEVPGGYARASGRRPAPSEIREERVLYQMGRRKAEREEFEAARQAELDAAAKKLRSGASPEDSRILGGR